MNAIAEFTKKKKDLDALREEATQKVKDMYYLFLESSFNTL